MTKQRCFDVLQEILDRKRPIKRKIINKCMNMIEQMDLICWISSTADGNIQFEADFADSYIRLEVGLRTHQFHITLKKETVSSFNLINVDEAIDVWNAFVEISKYK